MEKESTNKMQRKPTNAIVQEQPVIRFGFQTQREELKITAVISREDLQYRGKLSSKSNILIDEVQSMLEQRKYRVVARSRDELRIRVGAVQVELYSRERMQQIQGRQLYERMQEVDLRRTVDEQRGRIQLLQTRYQTLQRQCYFLNPMIMSRSLLRWSEHFKSDLVVVRRPATVTLDRNSADTQFALMDVGFSSAVNAVQRWRIKCNRKQDRILVGIGLKSLLQRKRFSCRNVDFDHIGHGCYLIGSGGFIISHSDMRVNNVQKNFDFGEGDTIDVEYDPINCYLKFTKNHLSGIGLSIQLPANGESYHPCVGIVNRSTRVSFVLTSRGV